MSTRAGRRWLAPTIVAAVTIVGAHPFCNAIFHCGCGLLSLSAHCNIHHVAPPHCPWCAQPLWFGLGVALALISGWLGIALSWRHTTALLPAVGAGLVGVVAGASAGALLTLASR